LENLASTAMMALDTSLTLIVYLVAERQTRIPLKRIKKKSENTTNTTEKGIKNTLLHIKKSGDETIESGACNTEPNGAKRTVTSTTLYNGNTQRSLKTKQERL